MSVTLRRLFLNPLWLLLSLPGYIGWRLSPALPVGPLGVCAAVGLLIVCCVVIPLSIRNHAIRTPALEHFLAWVGVLAMGFFSSLFVFTLLRVLVLLFVHFVPIWSSPEFGWPFFFLMIRPPPISTRST